ncbi:MAG TPA: hypothetical protein VLA49_20795 [Anaerolineales bacterium]|nr:hypothetical protein [Anaerolineales bacterium]
MIPKHTQDTSRLGFHYYPDTFHYTRKDLQNWSPILKRLGASWLVLIAPVDRAIPEAFLLGVIEAGIQPILHFHLPLDNSIDLPGLQLLFENYADWGVKFVVLFDRPNTRQAWPAQSWVQSDLAERFLDIFLPPAELAYQAGLIPVLPPLEPGGDYWDTAFLQAVLNGLGRRSQSDLLGSLTLSAYAYVEDKPLDWGAGGPERWPKSRPYYLPAGHQDQRGFYIFDWYLAQAQAVLARTLPIILLGAGSRLKAANSPDQADINKLEHAERNLALAERLAAAAGENLPHKPDEPISSHVLACNFWLLTAATGSPQLKDAWFLPDGSSLPVVSALSEWSTGGIPCADQSPTSPPVMPAPEPARQSLQGIDHYLLLPMFDWGVSEWYLDAIRPFVIKHHPTVGFSPSEAAGANRVTVVGGEQLFAEQILEELRNAGCRVDRITGDGTEIASILATQ